MKTRTLIIGGGPAGLSAALTLSRSLHPCIVLDSVAPARNHSCKHMHGVPGFENSSPTQFRETLRREIDAYGFTIFAEGQAAGAQRTAEGGFFVSLTNGETIEAESLLLACGKEDCLPEVNGFEQFWGSSVFYCPFCDGYEVRHKPWGVVVNRPEMLDAAEIYLKWASSLRFFIEPHIELAAQREAELVQLGVDLHLAKLQALKGDGAQLRQVRLVDGTSAACDALVWWPQQQHVPFVRSLELDLTSTGDVDVGSDYETTRAGIYATGDMIYTFHQNVQGALFRGAEAAVSITVNS
ncbi:NAD(P)/FAD-dependent oxidoreductase [Flexibacterium corallicola]|uniref:NAD(P)/FAD-dependent oxidoreductase n=1 Tax=Flexibacterium corallicola TaxID=3037259 RepID=UPI00286EFBE0|nr:NAD(P)/FAD-dependent oxidoreductase [Pseudovibrio sp. M1P-2-3]